MTEDVMNLAAMAEPPAGMAREEPPPALSETRSQWDRIVFAPDVELHVRRPLTRQMNRCVDDLIAAARKIFQEV
jgi:hypothetical protein